MSCPITSRLSLLSQTYTSEQLLIRHNVFARQTDTYRPCQRRAVPPEPTCHWLLTPGSWGVADAGFQPCGQIFEMSAPSALYRRIVAIPVLTFSYARVSETQTCPIVLPHQFKGDRSGTSLKGFPTIAEAMRWLTDKDLADLNHPWSPLESDLTSRAQIDLSFHKKPAFQIFLGCQGLEDSLWAGFDKQFFLKCSTNQM